jgi:hypothetical protein
MFVTLDLKMFYVGCVRKLILWLHNKLHVPSFCRSVVFANRQKTNDRFCTGMVYYFDFYENIT